MNGSEAAIASLQTEVKTLVKAVESLDKKVVALTAQANRWKGAFGTLLIVGGMAGSVLTYAATRWLK